MAVHPHANIHAPCLYRAGADFRKKRPLGRILVRSKEGAWAGRKVIAQKVDPNFATGSVCPSLHRQTVQNPQRIE